MSDGLYETVRSVKLTIKPDGTFSLEDAGMPKTGDVEYQGDHAVLHVKTMMGRGIESEPADVQKRNVPIQITPQKGGELTYYDPMGFDEKPLLLEKQKS